MSHLTAAASEDAFRELFGAVRDAFTFSDSNSASFAGFTAGYSVAAHLEDGTVDLRPDGTVSIKELDVKWDVLQASIGFDIPEICVGGWCIIPNPLPFGPDCLLEFPKICLFSANPDIGISLDLSGIVTTEISVTAGFKTNYFIDPGRTSTMSDLDAEDADVPNKWQVFLDPKTVDLDLFDIADIVGDLLEQAVTGAIDALIPGPSWVKSLILAILGPIIDLIRAILDLPDDIAEWFSDLLGVSLGLLNTLLTFVADYFAAQTPILEFEDPFPILPAQGGLIPVKIPIENFTITVTDDEMVLEADVGA
jgi:hypothetical protein